MFDNFNPHEIGVITTTEGRTHPTTSTPVITTTRLPFTTVPTNTPGCLSSLVLFCSSSRYHIKCGKSNNQFIALLRTNRLCYSNSSYNSYNNWIDSTHHYDWTPRNHSNGNKDVFCSRICSFFPFWFFQYFVYFCHIFAFLNYLLLVCFTCSREGRAQDGNLLHWPQHRLQYPLLLKLSLPIQRLVQPKVQTTIYHFLFLATFLPSLTLGFISLKSDLSNQYYLYFAFKLFCTLYLDVRFT